MADKPLVLSKNKRVTVKLPPLNPLSNTFHKYEYLVQMGILARKGKDNGSVGKTFQGPLLLEWVNFNPSMDK